MDHNELSEFFNHLDRSLFMDEHKAYYNVDAPMPIGFGQTISQPSLVVQMTQLLSPEKDNRVLEIGTGSGYQTAFLAEFSSTVYTIERFSELSDKARRRLDGLGYTNIVFRTGDGSEGWPEAAPFDRIIVTASPGIMPEALVSQLASGGRMLVPVGVPEAQILKLVTKGMDGTVEIEDVQWVRFVEMIGRYGWDKADAIKK